MFAVDPSAQPDRIPLVDELRCTTVDRIAHAIGSAVALQLGVREPEIDHDRVGVFTFILAFGTAVSKERLGWVDLTCFTRGKVLAFARRCRARAGIRVGSFAW